MVHGVNGVLVLLPVEVDGKPEDDKSSITHDVVVVCWMNPYNKLKHAIISAAMFLANIILGRVGQGARSLTLLL
jgi:hypothetical protein